MVVLEVNYVRGSAKLVWFILKETRMLEPKFSTIHSIDQCPCLLCSDSWDQLQCSHDPKQENQFR